jgi:hypothetical protein
LTERDHFGLEDGLEAIRDTDRVEADSADQAVEQALTAIAEMRDSGEIETARGWDLVIRDARGSAIRRLPIR